MKRSLFFIISSFLFLSNSIFGQNLDSLYSRLETSSLKSKSEVLINILDVETDPAKCFLLTKQLLNVARETSNVSAENLAHINIALNYISRGDLDSLNLYIPVMSKTMNGPDFDGIDVYYEMIYKVYTMLGFRDDADRINFIDKLVSEYKSRDLVNEDIYHKAERLFFIGVTKALFSKMSGGFDSFLSGNMIEDALELTSSMSTYSRMKFSANILDVMIQLDLNKESRQRKYVRFLKEYDHFYNSSLILSSRKFINKDKDYASLYVMMLKTAHFYTKDEAVSLYSRMKEVFDSNPVLLKQYYPNFMDASMSYFAYMASLSTGDTSRNYALKAISYTDSLINFYKRHDNVSSISMIHTLYQSKSNVYYQLGDYKSAFSNLKIYSKLKDSLVKDEYNAKSRELQVVYDLDKAELEALNLRAENRKIWLIILIFAVVIISTFMLFFFFNMIKVNKLRKDLEAQKQRAINAENSKLEVLGSISHEIRTPLNSIVGFSQIISESDIELEPFEKLEYSSKIIQNSAKLTALVDAVVDVSHLVNFSGELEYNKFNVTDIVDNFIYAFKSSNPYYNENISLLIDIDSHISVINTNKIYFTKILNILLSNSYHFTKSGSISVTITSDKNNLVLSVADTGCGVPPEFYEKIFDKFFKANKFTEGLGIGLYLGRLISKYLGATLSLDLSYTSSGAKFDFCLPIK